MATKSTVYKASIDIADMDRHYYQSHAFTVALHPSETDERMMIRLLAFALNASDTLSFTKGISTDEEPALWQKTLTDEIELWIEIGQLSDERIRKACNQSKQVIIYCYQANSIAPWLKKIGSKISRFDNLQIVQINCPDIEQLIKRNMQLQFSKQDGSLYFGDKDHSFECAVTQLV